MKCRHCGCELLTKDGIVLGKQRWKCKRCHKTTRENDARYKYSMEKRLKVLKMYLEGMGLKAIERLENVPNPLIIYWIKNIADMHIISKAETCLVESKNAFLRRKLARFHRKSCCFSKSIQMIYASLLLLFHQSLLFSLVIQNAQKITPIFHIKIF